MLCLRLIALILTYMETPPDNNAVPAAARWLPLRNVLHGDERAAISRVTKMPLRPILAA